MLDRNNTIPLYEQLKDQIVKDIKEGKYEANQQIPSERVLGEVYGVSRITVRQAISLAEKEGILHRVHGVGTFVSDSKIEQELSQLNNFHSTLMKQGLIASTKLLKEETISSDFLMSRLLDIDVMESVYNVQILGLGDESPIVYYNSYFTKEISPFIKSEVDKALSTGSPFSTLDLYTEQAPIRPTHIEQSFEARIAEGEIADLLDLDIGKPIFSVTSIVYADKKPLEYKETHYRGDKYKFYLTRKM
ncbi:GntR family transcriptional regulator [Alteribacillus iranensis]|uniref:Transcriptional regulator, GntR family n=1 Tax=Alteribacillus iranensis TaxID=930128 RepID=A0A1I2BXU3_9BACI|nr:GntR family transcriptional regulator [Alteribacillus iranensis]SFE60130.1 transcriptional regulator, GntR family [Alteribacillus iranensis]